MQIRILEARGIYKEGQEVDLTTAHAEQWVNSGFAEFVVLGGRIKKAAIHPPAKKPAEKKKKKVEMKAGETGRSTKLVRQEAEEQEDDKSS